MTIIFSASPGTASRTFNKNLEIILSCKSKTLKSGSGIGHMALNIPAKEKLFKKLKLNFFIKTPLIYGHIFHTKYNMGLLDDYYNIKHIIISYRNIYDQLNYYYKYKKYHLRNPLTFPADTNFSEKNVLVRDSFDIDLNLLLVLNFYKHWFFLIQNNQLKNYTLFSFDEITTQNKNYQNKILSIFESSISKNRINFNNRVKENFYKKEKFDINPRHIEIIQNFIKINKQVDFSLII